jgi:hypothetical protein
VFDLMIRRDRGDGFIAIMKGDRGLKLNVQVLKLKIMVWGISCLVPVRTLHAYLILLTYDMYLNASLYAAASSL